MLKIVKSTRFFWKIKKVIKREREPHSYRSSFLTPLEPPPPRSPLAVTPFSGPPHGIGISLTTREPEHCLPQVTRSFGVRLELLIQILCRVF